MDELKSRAEGIIASTCNTGHKLVWGDGSLDARIAIVGEAPGAKEEELGKPFVGPAGMLLDKELKNAGLNRSEIWVTNVVKCRPIKQTDGSISNRTPTAKEVKQWFYILMEELEIIGPGIIICAGAIAAKLLIRKDFAIMKEHGMWHDGPFRTRIIATFHPAYILRQVGRYRDTAIEAFRSDMRKAAE